MAVRADLHCHSRYSDQPEDWLLRRLGTHESYTSPEALYYTARKRGMDLVTITDHNDVRGAFQIAHLPATMVGVECTTTFPEDGCRIHLLAYGITAGQCEDMQRLRENIYELQSYLQREGIAHSVAHPLYRVDNRLTMWHLERLLLLFPCFETLNGSRQQSYADLMEWLLGRLTAVHIADLADIHDLEPVGTSPWLKGRTGGSDDHSGLFIGKVYTIADGASDTTEFLECLRKGGTRAEGMAGTAHSLAHSLYAVAHQFYKEQFLGGVMPRGDVLGQLLAELFGPEVRAQTIRDRFRTWSGRISQWKRPKDRTNEQAFKAVTIDALRDVVVRDWQQNPVPLEHRAHHRLNRETFLLASQLMNRLLYEFSRKAIKKLMKGSLFGSLQAMSALGPVVLGASPYLFAFYNQNKDRRLFSQVRARFATGDATPPASHKRAWFTDTLEEVNGVAGTVSAMAEAAQRMGGDLTILASSNSPTSPLANLKYFPPIGTIAFPEYSFQPVSFPPVLNVVDFCEQSGFTEVIISTTLFMGLTGLATAKLLGLPAVGVYHTDIPEYVYRYTEDDQIADLARRFARWFYAQMDRVYVRSVAYQEQLAEWGIPRERMRLFPKAVDLEVFHPRWRDMNLWNGHGLNGETKLLYVGRLAREKDLDVLVKAYREVRQSAPDVRLIVVGDGPYREELEKACAGLPVIFTGFLSGEALSRAYASCDLFVFPSSSDTFGNVVLEAAASGLPVIVSDAGGPQELLRAGGAGLVTHRRDPASLAQAILGLVRDPERRTRMGSEGRQQAESRSWDAAFLEFWEDLSRPVAGRDGGPLGLLESAGLQTGV